MYIIRADNLRHSYWRSASAGYSLDGVSLTVQPGEMLAILGRNGSGKTTLARHLNVLVPIQEGELTVAGLDARQQSNVWKIRRTCGMVFQNPDNQFVSSVVEEDLAFGPENYGESGDAVAERVRRVLEAVGMSGFERRSPHLLSGGQKQRIAIAGVLALDPQVLILDEATAMLDPQGRQEVLEILRRLRDGGEKTLVMITHYAEEAAMAHRVAVMEGGKLLGEGPPRQVLADRELLDRAGLLPPMAVRAFYDLEREGIRLPACPLTMEELVDMLCPLS